MKTEFAGFIELPVHVAVLIGKSEGIESIEP
jgi:hypothetical protein